MVLCVIIDERLAHPWPMHPARRSSLRHKHPIFEQSTWRFEKDTKRAISGAGSDIAERPGLRSAPGLRAFLQSFRPRCVVPVIERWIRLQPVEWRKI